ncbi:MAG: hypothetical protein KC502_10870 [Myxococcales bacterium]|nr:hypothetical protein [Myxococcales bacterium]
MLDLSSETEFTSHEATGDAYCAMAWLRFKRLGLPLLSLRLAQHPST